MSVVIQGIDMPTCSNLNSRLDAHVSRLRLLCAALAVAVAAVAMIVSFPARALAYDDNVIAYIDSTFGERQYFTSISDAINAGCRPSAETLVMVKDWNLSSTITIPGGLSITIDMNGCRIQSAEKQLFSVGNGASLTLRSSREVQFENCAGFDENGNVQRYKVKTGGLLTVNGAEIYYDGAILVGESSKLTLEGVTIIGVYGNSQAGGVRMEKGSSLTMSDGASIQHNRSGTGGGGVYAPAENVSITLDNASISNNYTYKYGGGIFCGDDNAVITLINGAKIENNVSQGSAGGVYFDNSKFKITSPDRTGLIVGNKCYGTSGNSSIVYGAGIHVDQKSGTNEGLIEGLIIKDNYTSSSGGGIFLGQEYTRVYDCTITGNSCRGCGGGIFVYNDKCIIDNCTITGNVCDTDSVGNSGGGVYVYCLQDIGLSNLNIIKGNTRGKNSGNYDDLMLGNGQFVDAYIKGNLAKGSSVGIRTATRDDRLIAKNFTAASKDCLFIDLDGYYVSYGTDHNGDAWQRHTTKEFTVTVNGQGSNRYKNGTTVTINGASSDTSKAFKCWKADGSTGLYPFSDYVKDADLTNQQLTFKMPQNDVNLAAEYMQRISNVSLTVDAVVAGEPLPTTGTLSWKDSSGNTQELEGVSITWTAGDESSVVSGNADYNTAYTAHATIDQDSSRDLAFALDMSTENVKVTVGNDLVATTAASVDATGKLTVVAGTVTTGNPGVVSVESVAVSVHAGASEQELRALLPTSAIAKTTAGATEILETTASSANLSTLLSNGVVDEGLVGQSVDFYLPLKSSEKVDVKAGDHIKVVLSVLAKPEQTVEAPQVTPSDGAYSTTVESDKQYFEEKDGKKYFKVHVAYNVNTDAVYQVSFLGDDGQWSKSDPVTKTDGKSFDIELEASANDQRYCIVETWAKLSDGSVESDHVVRAYMIDDVQPAKTYTVTVKQTDTGKTPDTTTVKTYEVEDSSSFSVIAQPRSGYVFEKWIDEAGEKLGDNTTLALEKVEGNTEVTAVYNPVISEINLGLALPKAYEALAEAVTSATAKAGDSDVAVNVLSYLKNKGAVTWSPAIEEDGKASLATTYTAEIALSDTLSSGTEKYILSPAAEVKVNGQQADGAYVAEKDGAKYLYVVCPATESATYKSLGTLDNIKLTYREALAAVQAQEASEGLYGWHLPETVDVTYEYNGTEIDEILGIDWSSVEGFDASAEAAQELTAKGTVYFPYYTDKAGQTAEVTVKILVAAPKSYTVSFNTAGGSKIDGAKVFDGRTVECPANPTNAGFTFAGWFTEDAQEYDFATPVTDDLTLYAHWTASGDVTTAYTVSFDTDGGTPAIVDATVTCGETVVRPDDPSKDGFDFAGWFTKDGKKYNFNTPVTDNLTLYAHWSTISYTVTFNSAGGSAVASQKVTRGDTVEKPANPTNEGFKFKGWYTEDAKKYDFNTPVTGDLTLYAHWTVDGDAPVSYTVTFNTAGGSEVKSQVVACGEVVKRPADPTKEGFTFDGWFTSDGEKYNFNTPVMETTELYAQWSASGEPTSAHVVTFDTAGGSEVASQTVADGSAVKQPDDPTKEGFTFDGWFTSDGEQYDFATPVTADLKLYAHWSAAGDDSKKDDESDEKDDESKQEEPEKKEDAKEKDVRCLPSSGDSASFAVTTLFVAGIVLIMLPVAYSHRKQ